MEKYWGKIASIDLIGCDHSLITDSEHIKRTTIELCKVIDMKTYGECHVVNFGESEDVQGYSVFQLIETSNCSGHLVNKTNAAYFDIFSCKDYNEFTVASFLKEAFKAKRVIIANVTYRDNYQGD